MPTRACAADVAVATAVGLAAAGELASGPSAPPAWAALVVSAVALAWRRPRPAVALLTITAALVAGGGWAEETTAPVLIVGLAAYSLGANAPARTAAAGLLASSAVLMGADLLDGGELSDAYFLVVMSLTPWLSGASVRRYRERAARLQRLAGQLERERDASAELARASERRRLAREVHEAVAGAVGDVIEPLAAAERAGPEQARAALAATQRTGRAAVQELQRVIGGLRAEPVVPVPDPPVPPAAPARGGWPAWGDAALAGALVAVSLVSAFESELYDGIRLPVAVLALAGLLVAVRRRHPLAAVVVAVAAVAAESLLLGDDAELPSALVAEVLALYSLAATAALRVSVTGLAVAVGPIVALALVQGHAQPADLVIVVLFLGVPWGAGLAAGRLHRQSADLRRVAAELTAERDTRARLAIAAERARAARDLHDSVAHSVSVMVLQAGAAEQTLDRDPDRARAAMRAAAGQGRRALDELRRLHAVLDAAEAWPGVASLDVLVRGVRSAGLPAELHVHGDRVPVPAGVGTAAYRIVQEALTNTLKHAGPVPTTVTLEYGPRALALEIRDAGGTPGPDRTGGGQGLVGMRERVAEHGGTLEAGPWPDGGFRVRAALPLAEPRP